MLLSTKEQHINFLQETILTQINEIVKQGQIIFSFMLIAQAIEILGAYLDNKPLRAKQQSSKRFELAIFKLFPQKYAQNNKANFLYYQLRTCLTHSFIPSNKIILKKNNIIDQNQHLSINNGVLILILDDFHFDLEKAINKLIKLIELDKIKLKKISSGKIDE